MPFFQIIRNIVQLSVFTVKFRLVTGINMLKLKLLQNHYFHLIFVTFLAFTLGYLIQGNCYSENSGSITEVRNIMLEEHIEQSNLSPEILDLAAITGMLEIADDPYAKYLHSSEFQEYLDHLEQGSLENYVGIGVFVAKRSEEVLITSVFPGSPAQEAGLLPGDQIVSVDSVGVFDTPLELVALMVTGPESTPVTLEIRRSSPTQVSVFEVTLTRSQISYPTVIWSMYDDIAYIAFFSFSSVTYSELTEVLNELNNLLVTGIVVDLRNNPGGLVTSVIKNTSLFLGKENMLIGYTLRSDGSRYNWESEDPKTDIADLPVVILVNEYTASGSEVFAEAMRFHKGSIVIGSPTFGKGSESTVRTLSDGSGLIYSSSYWFTPDGTSINGKGITPDIVIDSEASILSENDVVLNKAVELLSDSIN